MLTVAALYHFTRFPDPAALRPPLLALCQDQGIRGTLLLAEEGINGTIAGPAEGIATVLAHIRALPGCAALDWKESQASTMPFGKMKVRLKREIVTLGVPGVDPTASVGRYVEASDWNALISQPDVALIDTRNDYEIGIGTFDGAIDPGTESFRDFPRWWRENAAQFEGKRIAMFCTGGIRCEKASNFLLGEGVPEVFHLKGGILKYLETVPEESSRWQGECFVFDERVSLGHGLVPGDYQLCQPCGQPLSPEDRRHPLYEPGVSCHACHDSRPEADREALRRRRAGTQAEG